MSNGLFNKFELIDEMLAKLEIIADAKGVLRCGLIWDVSSALKTLQDGLSKEDEAHRQKIEAMKAMQEANCEEGVISNV